MLKSEPPAIRYHLGRKDLPIFSQQSHRPSTAEIMNILLDPDLESSYLCTSQPVAVEKNCLFIVDLRHMKNSKDLCDDMGSWVCNGVCSGWVSIDEDGTVDNLGKKPKCCDAYRFRKKYYRLKASPDLHKMVVYIEGELAKY